MTPFITAALTILGGVIVYVSGQIITKFFIEPLQEYKKTVGEIAYALVYYANITALVEPELQDEASGVFREKAARLRSSANQIAWYDWFARRSWTNLPPIESVFAASHALIGLSHMVFNKDHNGIDNLTEGELTSAKHPVRAIKNRRRSNPCRQSP